MPDAREDGRFADNPFVTGEAGIRFYAGAPLVTADGSSVGSLCVMDRNPRALTAEQQEALRALSRLVVAQMELKRRMRDERERANEVIREQERTLSVADEVIRKQERTLSVALSQLPTILWTTDDELRFTGAAGAGREVLRDADQDVRGMTLFAYFKTTDPEFGPIAAHRRALAGESVTYEAVWEGRTFQSHVEPLRDADGSIRGVIGIAFDVTPRKDAERELERSVSLLEATIDATADGILVVDAAGRMVHFNSRFVDLWDIPDEIAESQDESRAIAFVLEKLKDPAAFVKKVMTVYAQPSAVSHDVIELLDGRRIERDSRPQVVDGRTVGRVWSFRDVTERERAEREREESLSLLRATLEATADGVLVVDREGKIVSYNRKFVEMWGLPDSIVCVARRQPGDRLRPGPAARPGAVRQEDPRAVRPARRAELRLAGVQGRADVRALLPSADDRREDRRARVELPRRDAAASHGGHRAPARARVRPHLGRGDHARPAGPDRRVESRRREDVRLHEGADARPHAGPAAAGRARSAPRASSSRRCGARAAGPARSASSARTGCAGSATR